MGQTATALGRAAEGDGLQVRAMTQAQHGIRALPLVRRLCAHCLQHFAHTLRTSRGQPALVAALRLLPAVDKRPQG